MIFACFGFWAHCISGLQQAAGSIVCNVKCQLGAGVVSGSNLYRIPFEFHEALLLASPLIVERLSDPCLEFDCRMVYF